VLPVVERGAERAVVLASDAADLGERRAALAGQVERIDPPVVGAVPALDQRASRRWLSPSAAAIALRIPAWAGDRPRPESRAANAAAASAPTWARSQAADVAPRLPVAGGDPV
jgi:hypothetical protein